MSMTISGRVPSLMPVRQVIRPAPLRQLFNSLPSLWKSRTTLLPRINAGRRCYGSQGQLGSDGNQFAYTWVTKTPEEITPGDILSSLRPIRITSEKSQNVLLLLVTPSFAPWLDTASAFLEQCVNRLYDSVNPPSPDALHVLAAVIDRLPDPRANSVDTRKSDLQNSTDAPESEGISLLLLGRADVLGKAAQPRRIRSTEAEESALAFSVQTTASGEVGGALCGATYDIGLRLAKTMFINGNEHTLFGTRWAYNTASRRFEVDRSVNLASCLVKSTATTVRNFLDLPLHPVSQRRRVIASMGNILRQVAKSTDGESDDAMPASFELEKELPRYIAEHNIVDGRVSVWALLEKSDCAIPPETDSQSRVTESLRAGGRLLRVMSGGGGWGKKQGLLSLDPETNFLELSDKGSISNISELFQASGTDPTPEFPFPFDKQPPADDLPFLSQVAEPDDYIQFFVSVEPKHPRDSRSELSKGQEGAASYHFGVVSDTEGVAANGIEGMHQKDLVALPNYFGALSAKAITYSQPVRKAGSTGKVVESSTKLDVPGSRVELVLV